jgi:pimeloyl-ACP methyl ester carboxylesterase
MIIVRVYDYCAVLIIVCADCCGWMIIQLMARQNCSGASKPPETQWGAYLHQLWYKAAAFVGSVEMSNKPFVFLLPGMLCDAAVWQPQIAALEPHFDLAIPVFRGFMAFEAMAAYVLTLAPPRFSIVAHSMGGRVAMELMRLVPERITHFVVMDMGVHPVAVGERERNQALLALAEEGGLQAVADNWIPFMIHPSRIADTALTEAIRAMVLRNEVSDLHGQLLAAQQRADQSQYLAKTQHKIYIVCGDSDKWNTPALHQTMADNLPDAELKIIAECGHMVTMEKPDAVNALLLHWLLPRSLPHSD